YDRLQLRFGQPTKRGHRSLGLEQHPFDLTLRKARADIRQVRPRPSVAGAPDPVTRKASALGHDCLAALEFFKLLATGLEDCRRRRDELRVELGIQQTLDPERTDQALDGLSCCVRNSSLKSPLVDLQGASKPLGAG